MRGRHCLTDFCFWAITSGSVFAVLLVVEFMRGPDDTSGGLATQIRVLLDSNPLGSAVLVSFGKHLLLLVAIALVSGWVIQAIALLVGVGASAKVGSEDLDYGEVEDIGVGPDEPWEAKLDRIVSLKQSGILLNRAMDGKGSAAIPCVEPPGARAARHPDDPPPDR